jgi:hypothetical protein
VAGQLGVTAGIGGRGPVTSCLRLALQEDTHCHARRVGPTMAVTRQGCGHPRSAYVAGKITSESDDEDGPLELSLIRRVFCDSLGSTEPRQRSGTRRGLANVSANPS